MRIDDFLERLEDVKRSGSSCMARCPAHADSSPSLSIDEGENGGIVLNCFAGCENPDIVAALGLEMKDLMPDDGLSYGATTVPKQKATSKPKRTYATCNEAVKTLEKDKGKRSALWTYHDENGSPVGAVLRWDSPSGKSILPLAKTVKGWSIGGMSGPRPLYRLADALKTEGQIWVVEGEKCADVAAGLGLVAVCSAGGSNAPKLTNWNPLAGKECFILPDNDRAGRKYASEVASILSAIECSVRIVAIPGLKEKEDVADWVAAHPDQSPEALRAELEGMASETPEWSEAPAAWPPVASRNREADTFRPFPTDALPSPLDSFVNAAARAMVCDPSYVALPVLATLATAIGSTRRVFLKPGWSEPSILWAAIVGESGTTKSPAFKLALKPLRDLQGAALHRHAEEMRLYETELARHERHLSQWKRGKGDDDPPSKPEPPNAVRYVVSDVTVEALAPLLLANPRGLLLARDELAGWIGSFDRYAGVKGGDSAHWLSMYGGEAMVVDRKTGTLRTIYVPQAYVSVVGGIQPGILNRALGAEHRESGLAARLLLTCPPRKPKRWTEAGIDPAAEAEYSAILSRLFELQPATGDDDQSCPAYVSMTPDAKRLWVDFYNAHGIEQVDLSGDLSAAWSKLEGYGARLALIIHYARWAADDATLEHPGRIDADSMRRAVILAEWFKQEARRVYGLLSETGEDREYRRLTEWIRQKGGEVTIRELQQGHRQYRTAGDAEAALEELAEGGFGGWHDMPPGSKGGRPTRVFKLSTPSTSTEPLETREIGGFVDVDTVDGSETQERSGPGRKPSQRYEVNPAVFEFQNPEMRPLITLNSSEEGPKPYLANLVGAFPESENEVESLEEEAMTL